MKELLNIFFQVAKEVLENKSFEVEYWDNKIKTYGKGPKAFKVIIKSPDTARRILTEKTLGFGEEYMEGNIIVEGDLQSLLKLGTSDVYNKMKISAKTTARIVFDYFANLNTPRKTLPNIAAHYDKGVDFYSLWLDKSLTYSCAYFKNENDTLEQAQQNKYEHICRKLMLKEGESLVDIGCGFGEMLIYAVKNYGVRGVGYTLSHDQYNKALQRIEKEGLKNKIKIYLKDYREASGKFDKYVSIGMFEHVGKRYYKDFFRKTKELLKKDGLGVLHTIGHDLDKPTDPWLRKYIFPGGEIPALQIILDLMHKESLYFTDVENLRYHYHKTLEEWIKRFEGNVSKVRKMYGDKFVRMWRLYLNGSSSAFYNGRLFLYQITFTNDINNKLPLTRKYIYKD